MGYYFFMNYNRDCLEYIYYFLRKFWLNFFKVKGLFKWELEKFGC